MMKKLATIALFAGACACGAVLAQTSVGVSIGINQPGVYGRVDIGNYPQPVLVYPQPVIIAPAPVLVQRQPIYLYVPPGHQKHWGKHCARYNACGQPVYFVRTAEYEPGYHDYRDYREQEHDGKDKDKGRGRGKHGHGHDRDD